MSVMRQPRWVLFALITVLMCVLFGLLGRWQWHRHEDRRERNALYEAAATAPVVPVSSLVTTTVGLPERDQYRMVQLSGTYDSEHQVLQRNPKGRSGYAVITPLVTDDGAALLVDRGWTPASTTDANSPATDVTPPSGSIEATVRLRLSESPDDRAAPQGQIYVIDAAQIGDSLPYPLYRAYGELVEQSPAPAGGLELPESSTPGLGPHLFYAIQWWLFIGVAIGGFVLLVRRESQPREWLAEDGEPTDVGVEPRPKPQRQ